MSNTANLKLDSRQWIAAKAQGDRAELAVSEWFRGRGFEPYKTLGLAPFDLLLQCQVEVKHDLKAEATGNVAIETSYRGSPSGIMTTQASYWAIVVNGEALIAEVSKLRDLALRDEFPEVPAGENRASTVRLVPVEKLRHKKFVRRIQLPEVVRSDA